MRKFNSGNNNQPQSNNNGYRPNQGGNYNQQYPNYNNGNGNYQSPNYNQPQQPNQNYNQQPNYNSQPNPNNQQGYYQQPNPNYNQPQNNGGYPNSNGGNQQPPMPPQKPKKPFYKKWWFWLIAIILVFSIGGGLGNNSNKKSDKSTESNKTESVKTRSTNNSNSNSPEKEKNPKTNGPSLEDYKAIKLGENDGTTDSEIESEFGKPNTTSSQTIENVKADEKIWNKIQGGSLGGNFDIGFSNGKAISKGISGLKVTRNKKISLDDFNSIQNGQSESDIINKFGQPNGYSETSIANHNSKQLTYNSDIKGDLGANFILTFTDGKVSGKTQTSMK